MRLSMTAVLSFKWQVRSINYFALNSRNCILWASQAGLFLRSGLTESQARACPRFCGRKSLPGMVGAECQPSLLPARWLGLVSGPGGRHRIRLLGDGREGILFFEFFHRDAARFAGVGRGAARL